MHAWQLKPREKNKNKNKNAKQNKIEEEDKNYIVGNS